MTSRTGSTRRIWGDFEKVSELRWDLPRKKTVGFRLLVETFVAGATRVGVGRADEKACIERLFLSRYVEEPLNSKVIKSFLPAQRSRKRFSCFEIPMFYVIYVMNVPCTFCIFVYMAMVLFQCQRVLIFFLGIFKKKQHVFYVPINIFGTNKWIQNSQSLFSNYILNKKE